MKKLDITKEELAKYQAWSKAILDTAQNAQEDDAWHIRRLIGVGGSEIGSVLGVNTYKSCYQLWLEKTAKEEPFAGNNATYWGSVLEEVVANEYSKITHNKVKKSSKHYNAAKYNAPFCVGNVDRLINVDGKYSKILECKTARDNTKDENGENVWGCGNSYDSEGNVISTNDQIPLSYFLQVQHYMLCLDLLEADLAVLFLSTRTFKIYTIKRDDDLCYQIMQAAKKFIFDCVIDDKEPSMTVSDYDAVKGNDIAVDADSECLNLIAELNKVKATIKELKNSSDALENKIKEKIGLAQELKYNGKTIATYKAISRNTFDTARFKAENTELYNAYLVNKLTSRTLTLKKGA